MLSEDLFPFVFFSLGFLESRILLSSCFSLRPTTPLSPRVNRKTQENDDPEGKERNPLSQPQ